MQLGMTLLPTFETRQIFEVCFVVVLFLSFGLIRCLLFLNLLWSLSLLGKSCPLQSTIRWG
jgi:hypothetical protein